MPFQNFFVFKMPTRAPRKSLPALRCVIALLMVLLVHTETTSSSATTPARLLAERTGATQFEEERYEAHVDCKDHKHSLKKRSSDEDVDYEVYQGVVGRPGIDFPIYPRIPKTSFSCRSFGNGYFADMETDCQVFHICEEGRKISFLCPNGTIFQQSELTCDWWFKVNCLGSSGFYAESSEILSKQRLQRVRPSVPVQGFNIVGGGLTIKARVNNDNGNGDSNSGSNGGSSGASTQRSRQPTAGGIRGKTDRRMDSIEQHSIETVDFDDLSAEKQSKGGQKVIANIDDNTNNGNDNDEAQITAESASFVSASRRNGYAYEKANGNEQPRKSGEGRNSLSSTRRGSNGNGNGSAQRGSYLIAQGKPFSNDSSDKVRPTSRGGQQRFRDEKKPTANRSGINDSGSGVAGNGRDTKKAELPEKITEPIYVETKPRTNSFSITTETLTPTRGADKAATPSSSGSYSTARRLDSTRTTPFYTPTVPSIGKSKTTESKTYYIKNVKGGNVGGVATTPNPNRLSAGTGSSLFLESSVPSKATTSASLLSEELAGGRTTLRPFIIGMRHDYDTSSEVHRISVSTNNAVNVNGPVLKPLTERSITTSYVTTTVRPTTTGPTYLPNNASRPRSIGDAAGDELLFAPAPTADDLVARNVDKMLKTVNQLKDNLHNVEEIKYKGPAREGLDIPPSSGPDVLVSLAKYFAGEESSTRINSVKALDKETPQKSPKLSVPAPRRESENQSTPVVLLPSAAKPSDITTNVTTSAITDVKVKSDDIRAGLLREQTVNKYSNLFGLKDPKARQHVVDPSEGLLSHVNETAIASNSGSGTTSPFPQIGSTDATIRKIAEKPESRKIAQVFSNALTTYLDDPQSFREQLASVRPTEPPIGVTPNFKAVTTTDSTLFNGGTGATYLPTKPTGPTRTTSTTTRVSIASEINNKFDYATRSPLASFTSTTDGFQTTTIKPLRENERSKLQFELSGELAPPSPDSGEGDEFLQREQTQSFVQSRNNIATSDDITKKSQQKNSQSGLSKTTENPWVHISQTDFLDPLTINDGLMRESTSTTPSPFTYLPKKTTATTEQSVTTTTNRPIYTTTIAAPVTTGRSTGRAQSSGRLEPLRSNIYVGSAEVTTRHTTSRLRGIDEAGGSVVNGNSWTDIFETYDIPRETLPSNSGLQRIANKLFGGLNETEALHLKNVMLQAEHNRQVLGLLLLLIQTCDDQNGKALERSRKHLLNALIDMDGKVEQGKSTYDKSIGTTTTTAVPPVTTFRRNTEEILASTTPYATWTTTTTELPFSTTTNAGASLEETTRFEIRVPDLEEELSSTTPNSVFNSSSRKTGAKSSDKRALELLKSLYSLASKFSSRR